MRWQYPNGDEPESTDVAFKVCMLCGTPNVSSTTECATCGWHGRFDHGAESVEKAMRELRLASDEDLRDFFAERTSLDEYMGIQRKCNGWRGQIKRLFGLCKG